MWIGGPRPVALDILYPAPAPCCLEFLDSAPFPDQVWGLVYTCLGGEESWEIQVAEWEEEESTRSGRTEDQNGLASAEERGSTEPGDTSLEA